MCGIAGYYCKSNILDRADLVRMGNALMHRGPDAEGYFVHEKTGLAHRRLSIIDLSAAANQPMHSHDGRYVIVYNGEVYNFPAIREELEAMGVKDFRTRSDTEVVLEAFSTWGVDFAAKLNGMFAIAVYDKECRKLYLFRDHTGIKPLYVFYDGKDLAFASEIKALLAVPALQSRITHHTQAFSSYLHLGYIPEPETAYTHITKFPSGSYATYDGDVYSIMPYWEPETLINARTISNEEEASIQLKELLVSSVQMRMISDVPFGSFLSGGIDSSLVTAIAQNLSYDKLQTFSIGFKEQTHDESPFARAVADYLGTDHHELIVSVHDVMELLPEMLDLYDEPYADSSALPTMLLSKFAKQHVSMTLSGDGGDELFMGYGSYRWARRFSQKKWKSLGSLASVFFRLGGNRYRRIAEMLQYKSGSLRSHIFSQEQYLFSAEEIRKMMQVPSDFNGIDFGDYAFLRSLNSQEEQSFFDLKHYLKDDLLVKVDRASMRYSLETRLPLLDNRIIEFAWNLDPLLRLGENTTKYLLKKVLYSYLPASFFGRPKMGFAIPLNQWMKGPLRHLADEFLSPEMIAKHQIVKPEMVSALRKRFVKDANNYLYNRLWALIVLHRWLERK
jgi:asparagine synthase (glutamine-hydrolysing)